MQKLKHIACWFDNLGVQLFFVGGCVRDWIMGNEPEDIDICMVGGKTAGHVQVMLERLKTEGKIDNLTAVHGDFPIWIVEIDNVKYEFAMARKERKNGQSRQEFECEVADVTIQEDLYRRDLTINAIAKHIITDSLVDPYNGVKHITLGYAHPVSDAFAEDPLRVYRAARFIARFNLAPSRELFNMCKEMKQQGISNERVGMELMKLFKRNHKPSNFFYFLKRVGWLSYHFKELDDCWGVPQSPKHHPEGDVFKHTMHCIDAVTGDDWFMKAVMLCHDLGKATHTTVNGEYWHKSDSIQRWYLQDLEGRANYKISSAGHEEASVPLGRTMLQRISFCDHATIRKMMCLVKLHMIRGTIIFKNHDKIVRRTLRELMHHGLKYENLFLTVYYDLNGRPPYTTSYSDLVLELYVNHANKLIKEGAMEPIVTGDILVELGLKEGKELGEIVKHALVLQDRGTLKRDGNWIKVLKGAHPVLNPIYDKLYPKEDHREFPCPDCDEGEMQTEGFVSPSGIQKYVCNQCSHTESFP